MLYCERRTEMTDRYQEIRRALAMGPTPGPWEVINKTDVFTPLGARNAAGVEAAANDGWHIADCDTGPSFTEEGKEEKISYEEKRANAGFIAACDPDTIRALLDERDALAAEVERLAEALRELEEREQRDEARVMADKLTTELAACDAARPSTPVGWSDTDWIKHLQDQEPHSPKRREK
jgi:K+/H+ antiporter YhaU regulatory subunit KhtT